MSVDIIGRTLRAERANALIGVIASRGRRFFDHTKSAAYDGRRDGLGLVSHFQVWPAGQVRFVDGYTLRHIYVPYSGHWRHFTEGCTLRALVEGLYAYIAHGTPLPSAHFGPWPVHMCGGDLWGYGDAISDVRVEAVRLGIVREGAYDTTEVAA